MGWMDAPEVDTAPKWASAPEVAGATGEAPQFAPNGVPMNAAAKAELASRAKAGTLRVDPQRAGDAAGMNVYGKAAMDRTAGEAFAGNLAQGLTFGFADEIGATVGSALGGGSREEILANLRRGREQDEALFPKSTLGADITGSIAGTYLAARAGGPAMALKAPATMLGKTAAGLGGGAVLGATEGAISGAGYADGKDTGKEALKGAASGALLGGAIGAAVPAVTTGIRNLATWAKGYDSAIIARTLGVDKKTASMIKASLSGDSPDEAIAAMRRAGPDAMLADAGPGPAALLDAAMQNSGGASRVAAKQIEARAAKAGQRIEALFDGILGKAETGIKTAAKGIAARTSATRSALYERAFAQPIDYASEAGAAVEATVGRVPRDILTKAVKAANDAMQIDGVKNLQIMAKIADDGTVSFSQPLNLLQLNEVKKALDEIGREAVDQFGRQTGEGRRIAGLARDLRGNLGKAVPAYDAAVRAGGDKIAEDQALELGRTMLSPNVTREKVAEGLADASQDALAAAKRGLRIAIDEQMANVRSVISDPNIDAREALSVIKGMSSKAARAKIETLLGKGRARAVADALDEASAHLELRAAVARNSATASRTSINDAAKGIVGDTIMDKARDGEPINAAKAIVRTLTGGSEARKTEELKALYANVAKALTGPRGDEAREAMMVIGRAINGQVIKTDEAEKVARVIANSAALSGYQSGQKYLETRQ